MGVSYALAVTEPHSSGLGGGGATLTYNGNEGEEPKMYEYKTHLLIIIRKAMKLVHLDLCKVCMICINEKVKWMRRKFLVT